MPIRRECWASAMSLRTGSHREVWGAPIPSTGRNSGALTCSTISPSGAQERGIRPLTRHAASRGIYPLPPTRYIGPLDKRRNRRTHLKRVTYRVEIPPIMGYIGRLRRKKRLGIHRKIQNMVRSRNAPLIPISANLLCRPIWPQDPTQIEKTAPMSLSM